MADEPNHDEELPSELGQKGAPPEGFLRDALAGLSSRPRSLPCKYFYDHEGSRLFERITTLDAYYPTRTEASIFRAHAPRIAAWLGPRARLVEPGAGSCDKTRLLLDATRGVVEYVPIDLSGEHLCATARALEASYPGVRVRPLVADFAEPFELPSEPPSAPSGPLVTSVFFPGSTLGNFDADAAARLLGRFARLARGDGGPGGVVIVGLDLVKDVPTLLRAYDDEEGVTAAFNANLLRRLVSELGASVALEDFVHEARWDEAHERIEMRLVARRPTRIALAGRAFAFEAGEPIVTEHSHKYRLETVPTLLARAGLAPCETFVDERGHFAVVVARGR